MARRRQRLVAWLVIVTQLPPSKLEIVTPLPPFSNLQAVEIDTVPSQASNLRGLVSKSHAIQVSPSDVLATSPSWG